MTWNKKQLAVGKLLIAEPFLQDSSFQRTVILITEYSEKGSMGFILNRPIEVKLNDSVREFPDHNFTPYYGGPVGKNSLFYIYKRGDLVKDSVEICDGLFWGGKFSRIKELIESEVIKKNEIRFFIGYSGWDAKQLDEEIEQKSWLIGELKTEFLFNETDHIWQNAIKNLGAKYEMLANFPIHPSLN